MKLGFINNDIIYNDILNNDIIYNDILNNDIIYSFHSEIKDSFNNPPETLRVNISDTN